MDEQIRRPKLRIKRENVELIQNQAEVVWKLFSVRIGSVTECDKSDSNDVLVDVEWDNNCENQLLERISKLQGLSLTNHYPCSFDSN
ncbi:hypothetical protein RUM43_003771 [Polyplax serrata]|uniref:Uncharacterized protein n=1 Tax=Polyplax serrata TaxID=468196 RepID=A0AAN8P3N2_POLSC